METLDRIREILATGQFIDPARIREDATFEEAGMDSLDLVDFSYEIEDAFGIQIERMDEARTFGDVARRIDELCG